ncbi:unnamed protein product [Rhizoctonia solani]|uniref:Transmembrane protein n=1 Tax=Rhizoctonia solani TaxID=456999 RepID=A0A8H2XIW5_9AGAM|nr:unnamed protein product [Rhizoctonia solani]
MLRSHLPFRRLWRSNTKDVFMCTLIQVKQPRELRMFGHPRNPPISLLHVPFSTTKPFFQFISLVFFRRVSPVETRSYAFIRNLFGAAAVGVILFRTATALLQAQNKIDTRMKSRDCSEDGYQTKLHDIQVLTEYDYGVADIAVFSESLSLESCAPMLSQQNGSTWMQQTFICGNVPPQSQIPIFRIEVSSPSGSTLTDDGMPQIWLSNRNEEGQEVSLDQYKKSAVRVYSPVWRLRPGFHVEAKAKLITRRFISSSFFRDTVLHSDSKYTQRSLYPIFEIGRSALVDSMGNLNFTRATATIHATLDPGFENYYRSQEDFWRLQKRLFDSPKMCDYIEDYRSGSVLDVLGSVGGLFALLYAAHVLIFRRPLLWGLTGAKLITPFGLLGIFSSADFKRRLREHYHREPTQGDPEPFRIGAFLRDFVVDLGPAGIHKNQEPDSKSSYSHSNQECPIENETPLVHLHSDCSPSSTQIDIDRCSPSARNYTDSVR